MDNSSTAHHHASAHHVAKHVGNSQMADCHKKANAIDVDHDDLPSTAAPSVMHSPNGGPGAAPEGSDLDITTLRATLSGLSHDDSPAPSEPESGTPALRRAVEGLFQPEHLREDFALRVHMTQFGWVPLREVLQLPALQPLHATVPEAAAVLRDSRAVQLSGDSRRVRARDPSLWSAFVHPEKMHKEAHAATHSPASTTCTEECRSEVEEVADEDLTIAASIEVTPRASKEGSPWPCVEWLTAEPMVGEHCLEWLLSEAPTPPPRPQGARSPPRAQPLPKPQPERRRAEPVLRRRASAGTKVQRRRQRVASPALADSMHGGASFLPFDSELSAPPGSPASGAWLRDSDESYAAPAANLLGW